MQRRNTDPIAMEPLEEGMQFDDYEADGLLEKNLLAKKKRKQAKTTLKRFMCFMFLLAVGNAIASVVLVNKALTTGFDVQVNDGQEDDIVEFARFSYEEREERRLQVVQGSSLTDGKLHFDVGVMDEMEFNSIQAKCERKKNVVVRRTWEDGSSKLNTVCQLNSSVLVKPKKMKNKNRNKNKNGQMTMAELTAQNMQPNSASTGGGGSNTKPKKNNKNKNKGNGGCRDREIVVNTDGYIWNVNCEGCRCYQSGSVLLSKKYEPCDLRYNNDDCQQGLVCSRRLSYGKAYTNPRDLTGTCTDPVVASLVEEDELTYMEEGSVCELKLGDFACEEGLYCRPEDGTYGICTAKVFTMATIKKRQKEGRVCSMSHRNKACVVGFYCKNNGDETTGVCTREKVSLSVSIKQLQSKNEVCLVSFGNTACKPGLYCVPNKKNAPNGKCSLVSVPNSSGNQEKVSVSTPSIPRQQGEGQVCDISFGSSACQANLYCQTDESFDASIGICMFKVSTPSIKSNQGVGEICDVSFGSSACKADLYCQTDESFDASIGICMFRVSTPSIKSNQGEGQVCDISFGSSACKADLYCHSDESFDSSVGICMARVSTPIIPRRQGEGTICLIAFGEEACKDNLICFAGDATDASAGICQRRATPALPKFAEAGELCVFTYGDEACKTGLYCIFNNGPDASLGVCTGQREPQTAIPIKHQEPHKVCLFTYGLDACMDGYICISSDGLSVGQGLCEIAENQVEIQPNQGQGMACLISHGSQACIEGYVCVSNGGVAGHGICNVMETQTQIPVNQGSGMACLISHGSQACIEGYTCVTNNGASGRGICQINSGSSSGVGDSGLSSGFGPGSSGKWYVDWESQQCIRDCESGRAPNCGGIQPFWDNNNYETAENCCSSHLSWKRFEECIPEYPII